MNHLYKLISRFHRAQPSESGISLIGVLVAAGVAGIIGSVMMKTMTNSMRSQADIGFKNERLQIARHIDQNLDCRQTLAPLNLNTCTATNQEIDLKRRDGSDLLKADKKLGPWQVEARCEEISGDRGISIRLAKRSKADPNQFAEDPLRRLVPLDFNHPQARLHLADARPCMATFAAGSVATRCATGQIMVGVQLDGGPICEPMPSLAQASAAPAAAAPQNGKPSGDIEMHRANSRSGARRRCSPGYSMLTNWHDGGAMRTGDVVVVCKKN